MCGNFATFLVFVGTLVSLELRNPDKVLPIHLVKTNQSRRFQFSQKRGDVYIVKRKNFAFDFLGAIF